MRSNRSHDLPVARQAAEVPEVFARRFNTGDLEAVLPMYAAGAILIGEGGPATGGELDEALARHLSLGLPISTNLRHVYEHGDTALLLVEWVIDGKGRDGTHVHLEGTATDVAKRDGSGVWRYLIDNPFGTATPPS